MRSLLTRMAIIGAVGIALSGCGNANGTSFSPGGSPNGAGGGNINSGSTGITATTPIIIDDGTVAIGSYSGFNTTITDTQSATEVGTVPAGDATDKGSHSITFGGNSQTSEIFKYTGTVPNLTYQGGVPGNTTYTNYSSISFSVLYTPAATSPGATPAAALELTGGSGASAYDFRLACTGAITPAKASTVKCTLPAYGVLTDNGLINPSATGAFTPLAATLYVVLVYGAATPTASTGNVLLLDNLVAAP